MRGRKQKYNYELYKVVDNEYQFIDKGGKKKLSKLGFNCQYIDILCKETGETKVYRDYFIKRTERVRV